MGGGELLLRGGHATGELAVTVRVVGSVPVFVTAKAATPAC